MLTRCTIRSVNVIHMDIINANDIFCDEYKAVILCEYKRELALLKRLISIADDAVNKMPIADTWSHDGVCRAFEKSIVAYSKMAYDNFIIGHFDATNMIIRAIVENSVCLEIIFNDETDELWKYYIVQSLRSSLTRYGKGISEKDNALFEKMYQEYEINPDFLKKREKRRSYIDSDYGWSYTINPSLTFKGLCDLVEGDKYKAIKYKDFKLMSTYSHGTSFLLKIGPSTFMENIMGMISCIYIWLYELISKYCWEYADDDFDDVCIAIEDSLKFY